MCAPSTEERERIMSTKHFTTIPAELLLFFDHIQVEAAMRSKLDWLQESVKNFLEKKPTHEEIKKFLVATQDEILSATQDEILSANRNFVWVSEVTFSATGGRVNR